MPFSQPDASGVVWEGRDELVRVEAWGDHGLRIRSAPGDRLPVPLGEDGALLEVGGRPAIIEIRAEVAVVRNGDLAAELSADGRLRFLRSTDGRELLAEEARHFVGPLARHYFQRPDGLPAGRGELPRV